MLVRLVLLSQDARSLSRRVTVFVPSQLRTGKLFRQNQLSVLKLHSSAFLIAGAGKARFGEIKNAAASNSANLEPPLVIMCNAVRCDKWWTVAEVVHIQTGSQAAGANCFLINTSVLQPSIQVNETLNCTICFFITNVLILLKLLASKCWWSIVAHPWLYITAIQYCISKNDPCPKSWPPRLCLQSSLHSTVPVLLIEAQGLWACARDLGRQLALTVWME